MSIGGMMADVGNSPAGPKKKVDHTLTAAKRAKLKPGVFAGPGRSFPIPDALHARLAISGATRSEHAGNISPAQEASIKAQARNKLGM